jgi:hypothetical protein
MIAAIEDAAKISAGVPFGGYPTKQNRRNLQGCVGCKAVLAE